MITTQDFKKGVDLTGLTIVTGSQVNQLVDAGRAGPDKGLIVETTDTALNTPEVPNPDGNYTGVLPIWWKRYRWRRVLFDGTVKFYYWQESFDPDEFTVYLKWLDEDTVANTALANAIDAQVDATNALSNSNVAISTANTANTNATNAQSNAAIAISESGSAVVAVAALQAIINALWAIGDLKNTCKSTTDAGWLECNGQAVLRSTYSALFAVIGTTWGVGDAVTTFNVPDFRGRSLIGAGTGAGLTARTLGQQAIGEEAHTLLATESGVAAHHHNVAAGLKVLSDNYADYDVNAGAGMGLIPDGTQITADVAAANAALAHNVMQPSAVVRILIKAL